jgi:ribosome maturation factor RimP
MTTPPPAKVPASPPAAMALNPRQKQRLLQTLLDVADTHLPPHYAAVASELVFEFGCWMIRLFVDRRGARITIDECEQISRLLVPHIEELAEIATLPYMIEIGSPGLFRVITTDREVAFYQGWAVAPTFVDSQENPLPPDQWPAVPMPIQSGYLVGRSATDWLIAPEPFAPEAPPSEDTVVALAIRLHPGLRIALNPPVEWPDDDEEEPGDSDGPIE